MKEQAQVFSKDIRQIDLDVNRTFRNHIMFRDRYGVGYCQGMSEMVAILVMFLSEEDAFWALAQLMTMETHAMHGRGPAGRLGGTWNSGLLPCRAATAAGQARTPSQPATPPAKATASSGHL
ncbi:USP6 N-terminal-like protein [Lontra canadensis]|uniref:USP6 N-terminal-like protein n=1 Tax=Lontra canadensis TaxID=76717 RepID=UPI0013F36D74|nr:USP6 N-terminal-like protein [Lontra canadensis]